MNITTFVAFDTETTGFSPTADRIVELAAVKFRGSDIIDQQSWLINPGIQIPEQAQRVHGISQEMVADSPSFPEPFAGFHVFIENAILIAHNASFDISFLNAELQRHGMHPPSNEVLDSLKLSHFWFPKLKRHSLAHLVAALGIYSTTEHRALADAMAVVRLFRLGIASMPADSNVDDLMRIAGLRF